ncbi:MAG: ribosome maturation factor RimM [Acidobacteria bacterium]|nr:ribosome maturation factor RimM [Acidobacteriota bacterium]
MADRIAVGVIRKAHGVRGEASVEPWTGSVERFLELKSVTLVSPDERSTRPATIEAVRFHAGRALIQFAEIGSPEDVQMLRGWTVEIPESDARALEEDEYFLHDLAGLTLIDGEGRSRGVVEEAYEGGGGILLTVRREDETTYEVPFAADICTTIDLQAKRILVALPDGIDEL